MNENDLNGIIIDLGEQLGQAAIDKSILRAQHRAAINDLNIARDRIATLESKNSDLEGELIELKEGDE